MDRVEARLRDLLVRANGGAEAAYREFLAALAGHLRAFLRGRLASHPDEVEDLVQETLLAIHNQRHTYDPDQPVTAWAHAIARYKLIDWLRRHGGIATVPVESADAAGELGSTSAHDAAEARRDLGRLLEQLPARQRLPIVQVKLEGRSVVEAAAATGMSVAAVKVNIHRGLKALAASLRSGDADR